MSGSLRVAICGGGNLAHALAAVVGAVPGFNVRVLTRRPQPWKSTVRAVHGDVVVEGSVHATSDPGAAVAGAELVIVAAPAYAHAEIITAIAPHLHPEAWLGALPAVGGFDHVVRSAAPSRPRAFGSLRSPYNARIVRRGSIVEVTGVVPRIDLVTSHPEELHCLEALLREALGLPLRTVEPFIAATLSPGSTIFHPSRLYELCTQDPAVRTKSFYGSWGRIASETYLDLDRELTALRSALGIDLPGIGAKEHYGTDEPEMLTRRIRGLKGLPSVKAPFHFESRVLDTAHRFVQEDLPYGLAVVERVATLAGVPGPTMSRVLQTLRAGANCEAGIALKLPERLSSLTLREWLHDRSGSPTMAERTRSKRTAGAALPGRGCAGESLP